MGTIKRELPDTVTVNIPKTEKDITIDIVNLSQKGLEFYLNYGIKQALNDRANMKLNSFISGNSGERWTAETIYNAVMDRATAIDKGQIRTPAANTDQRKAEYETNVKWMKALGFSSDDIKANRSDTSFVISAYMAKVANNKGIDREDVVLWAKIRAAIETKYETEVSALVEVYAAQRAIKAEALDGLEIDIDLDI